jgi:general secretion pathway protein J
MTRRARGFTLIEVLVSVFLLSVLSALCYETLAYVRHSREVTVASFGRLRDLELAIHTLASDFSQAEPRPVRDALGETALPALFADARSSDLVAVTRGGWANTSGLPRGTLQRVTYSLENGSLVRKYYTALDATPNSTLVRREILHDVVSVTFRYLDANRAWQTQWPALSTAGAATNALPLSTRPLAVEVVIELADVGKIRRLIEVPG